MNEELVCIRATKRAREALATVTYVEFYPYLHDLAGCAVWFVTADGKRWRAFPPDTWIHGKEKRVCGVRRREDGRWCWVLTGLPDGQQDVTWECAGQVSELGSHLAMVS